MLGRRPSMFLNQSLGSIQESVNESQERIPSVELNDTAKKTVSFW